MTEEDLKAKILELENEIKEKDREIYDSYDRIDQLEETIMKLELCLDEEGEKNSKEKKKSIRETKLEIELDEKEKEIRDLKNRMGGLRKEKTQIQRELEKYTKVDTGTVIRIEEKKEPFETLVKELQDKINKQNRLINDLKNQVISSKEFQEKMKLKEERILSLENENKELNAYVLSIKNTQEETEDNLLYLMKTKEADIEKSENKIEEQKNQLKNIKEVFGFQNKIISELKNQIQSQKSLWSDSQLKSKLKRLEELNEKMSKYIV